MKERGRNGNRVLFVWLNCRLGGTGHAEESGLRFSHNENTPNPPLSTILFTTQCFSVTQVCPFIERRGVQLHSQTHSHTQKELAVCQRLVLCTSRPKEAVWGRSCPLDKERIFASHCSKNGCCLLLSCINSRPTLGDDLLAKRGNRRKCKTFCQALARQPSCSETPLNSRWRRTLGVKVKGGFCLLRPMTRLVAPPDMFALICIIARDYRWRTPNLSLLFSANPHRLLY